LDSQTTSQTTSQPSGQRPATNQQTTTSKELKNIKNKESNNVCRETHTKNSNTDSNSQSQKKLIRFIPPTLEEAAQHFFALVELGKCPSGLDYRHEAERFINHYSAIGWKPGKNKIENWKGAANNWKQDYSQGNINGTHQQASKHDSPVDRCKAAIAQQQAERGLKIGRAHV